MKQNTPPHLKAILFLATLALACWGCTNATGTRVERDAALCLRQGPCTVLQVDSRNLSDAVLYTGTSRLAYALGLSKTTLFIPRWRFDSEGCVVLQVRLIAGETARTTRECVRDGTMLELDIMPSSSLAPLHIWLNPRGE